MGQKIKISRNGTSGFTAQSVKTTTKKSSLEAKLMNMHRQKLFEVGAKNAALDRSFFECSRYRFH